MIIRQINVESICLFKSEDHAPVRTNSHRPEAFQLAFEGMQSKARQVHIRHCACRIKPREDVAELDDMLRHHAAVIVLFIKTF